MGAVNTTYTFTATDTITSTKMNNIIDETVMTADAVLGGSGGSGGLDIASGKLSISANAITNSRLESNSVTSDKIVDGTIVNADINASAAIAGTKIAASFGNQNITANGDIGLEGTASDYTAAILNNTSGVQTQLFSNANLNGGINTVTNHPLTISTNNTERMRISASGNVGIGTVSPQTKLQVAGGTVRIEAHAGEGGQLELLNAANNDVQVVFDVDPNDITRLWTIPSEPLSLGTNGTEQMRITGGGNVGIGTTTPSTKLQVNGTVTATAFSGPLTGNVTGNASSASTVSNSAITAAKLDGNQSGSAPIYGCRAWVSFAGRSTNGDCTIRSAGTGNVYRVARTAEGRYTVYFTTAMQDENYATITGSDANAAHKIAGVISQSAGTVDIAYSQIQTSTSRIDPTWGQVSIFR
jgi:hypothetical protein